MESAKIDAFAAGASLRPTNMNNNTIRSDENVVSLNMGVFIAAVHGPLFIGWPAHLTRRAIDEAKHIEACHVTAMSLQ